MPVTMPISHGIPVTPVPRAVARAAADYERGY